jgi:hypothetical protein
MHELVTRAVDAHGGLERWQRYGSVTASLVTGGGLWALKGLSQDARAARQSGQSCTASSALQWPTAAIRRSI